MVNENLKSGHDVLVIASTEEVQENGQLSYVKESDEITDSGYRLIRVPYVNFLFKRLTRKIRLYKGVYKILDDFKPDVIMFHGMCAAELLVVARYKRRNQHIKFFVDTHSDFINSAKSLFSKWLLHYCFYRTIVRIVVNDIDKVFYISPLTEIFARDFYGLEQSKLSFLPLGGHPVDTTLVEERRKRIRLQLNIPDDAVLFIQSGKQNKSKRLLDSLFVFDEIDSSNCYLVICGSIADEISDEAMPIINRNERIIFLGWTSPERLCEVLCAADIYLQPGSQSATMQMALCCSCIPILERIYGHDFYTKDFGWLVSSREDLYETILDINANQSLLEQMRSKVYRFSKLHLDYRILAESLVSNGESNV